MEYGILDLIKEIETWYTKLMEKDNKFRIENLQRTKIIMAVEAVVVNTSVMIGIYLVRAFLPDTLFTRSLVWVGGIFGIAYALYASLGNAKRHMQIKRLEKSLAL